MSKRELHWFIWPAVDRPMKENIGTDVPIRFEAQYPKAARILAQVANSGVKLWWHFPS